MTLKSGDALFKAHIRNENILPEDGGVQLLPHIIPAKTRWDSSDVIDELVSGKDFMLQRGSGDQSAPVKERYRTQTSVRLNLGDVLEMDDDSYILDSPTIECIEFLTGGDTAS